MDVEAVDGVVLTDRYRISLLFSFLCLPCIVSSYTGQSKCVLWRGLCSSCSCSRIGDHIVSSDQSRRKKGMVRNGMECCKEGSRNYTVYIIALIEAPTLRLLLFSLSTLSLVHPVLSYLCPEVPYYRLHVCQKRPLPRQS